MTCRNIPTYSEVMAINTVKTVTVFVSDQDRAREFYVGALGLEVKVDQTFGDNRWLEVGAPTGTTLVLHKPFPGASAGGGQGTIVATDDLDADIARLQAAGVIVEGPNEMPWGKQATFADPDGNGYVLQG
ncbi:glyoxalase superfamily protein [Kribbella hippodromi]